MLYVVYFTHLYFFDQLINSHSPTNFDLMNHGAMWGVSTHVMVALIRAYPEALDDGGYTAEGVKGHRTPRHFSARFERNQALLNRSTEEWRKMIGNEK
mmetsp:Transcript_14195/g.16516  ORF Transcript_14195/g.16516 Transcript_14195/m.16516 type:complete len:98 (-) Transcript_14195:413-706(-)